MKRTKPTGWKKHNRSGAALVEGAVIGSVFLLTLFVTLDLALAVLRYNALSEASRSIARAATVRGERSSALTVWGPARVESTMSSEMMESISAKGLLVTMDPDDVQLVMEWPDGGNQVNDRVRITLLYEYQPLFKFGLGDSPFNLTAVSTMRIHH